MIKYIDVNDKNYQVSVKKSNKAKHLQLKVYKTGEINLIVPRSVTYYQANEFLINSKSWIEKKVSKFAFGKEKFRYLGKEIDIKVISEECSSPSAELKDSILIVRTPNLKSISAVYEDWLYEKAKDYIPSRTKELAEMYDFTYNKVNIKKLKSRWGSCSAKRNLSFNYKLMYFNNKVVDYVIVHELCHLTEMNHSTKFWNLVKEILPDYKTYKNTLSFN